MWVGANSKYVLARVTWECEWAVVLRDVTQYGVGGGGIPVADGARTLSW